MMLAGPELRAVPVTIHIALADVPTALSTTGYRHDGPHHRQRSQAPVRHRQSRGLPSPG